MDGWLEIGRDVFCRRYEPWDVTVGVVVGAEGLLVVDTRASHRQGDELRRDLRRLDRRPPRWVVNTHWHFDHTFGNARFVPAQLWGHETVPAALETRRHETPQRGEYSDVTITPPDNLVREHAALDLGGRLVDLRHLGRGHTDGDLVILVPDAGVVFAGDLVEESGPPSYGDDSFPLEWPDTVDRLLSIVSDADKIVPGHGEVVNRAFMTEQRETLVAVARRHRQVR